MVLEVVPPVLAAALIYFLIRRHWQKKSLGSEFKAKREAAFWNEFIRLLLVCSVCAIIFIGVFPYNFWRKLWDYLIYHTVTPPAGGGGSGWRYTPYVISWIEYGEIRSSDLEDLLLNIVFFMPLGLFLPLIMKKPALWRVTLIGFIFTVLVEASQLFTNHQSDINDVIANTLGAFAGYLVYLAVKKLFPGFTEKCRVTVWGS